MYRACILLILLSCITTCKLNEYNATSVILFLLNTCNHPPQLYMYMYVCVGMLGKSKGQILRVGAGLHILFEMFSSDEKMQSSDDITEAAIVAAISYTDLCLQQTAFMSGRGTIIEDIENIKASKVKPLSSPWVLYQQITCRCQS